MQSEDDERVLTKLSSLAVGHAGLDAQFHRDPDLGPFVLIKYKEDTCSRWGICRDRARLIVWDTTNFRDIGAFNTLDEVLDVIVNQEGGAAPE